MGYTEMLLRVRARSFIASIWPDRPTAETEPPDHVTTETGSVPNFWMRFQDEHEPRFVGLLLSDVSVEDPVFVVVLVYSDGRVRRALWHYRSKRGWRRLGSDGDSTP